MLLILVTAVRVLHWISFFFFFKNINIKEHDFWRKCYGENVTEYNNGWPTENSTVNTDKWP